MAEIFSIFNFFLFIFFYYLSSPSSSLETDTITSAAPLRDPDTIISPQKLFKFGFFTPAGAAHRYAGVFYAFSESTVAWVANRENPLPNSSVAAAAIASDGNLVLLDSSNQTVWSTNTTTGTTTTSLKILDTGNLVLLDSTTGATLWESFSQPCNVLLPTMKISDNLKTNKKVLLTSWKTPSDPSTGSFSFGIEARGIPEQFVRNSSSSNNNNNNSSSNNNNNSNSNSNSSNNDDNNNNNNNNGEIVWRSGPWNGLIYLGIEDMFRFYVRGFSIFTNDSNGSFEYVIPLQKIPMQLTLNSSGNIARTIWDDGLKSWKKVWSAPEKACDLYKKCGPYGICDNRASPVCSCLRGFEPSSEEEWRRGNWSRGCTRRKPLQCDEGGEDGFWREKLVKVPDFGKAVSGMEEDECREKCLRNCSCLGYAHDANIGCMFWDDRLVDVERFDGVGVDLSVRLSSSELDEGKDRKLHIIIPVVVVFVCVSVLVLFAWCWMVKRKGERKLRNIFGGKVSWSDSRVIVVNDESKKVNTGELPHLTFEILATATDQFNENSLLGRGGFGPVYKGCLQNGKEIAVKRLSTDSGQGLQEFMNEVTVMSKLQHRNLVKLIGGCVEKEEKILVYEYMPNKSLDLCLFDHAHSWGKSLDWKKRFAIIEGVARGLLYLHRDSRLRIIHRDLKPSNVLLDQDWNPKISDFGMARIFGGSQDYYNTTRVVGTLRYMAPEYAMEGRFSEKSDVYSFGVLMLEIVKGKRITHYYDSEWNLSLLGCAWKAWSEGNGLNFSDESILSLAFEEDIVRCIHIGLLCVQDSAEDRPTIQTVVSMLSREIASLPSPKQPLFAEKWSGVTVEVGHSINELTLTVLQGR